MHDVKTWDEINASPLLQLSPAERQRLHETQDERFRAFWADCFLAAARLPSWQKDQALPGHALDGSVFSEAFLKAFDGWEPQPGKTFSDYLNRAVQNAQNRLFREENPSTNGFGRETNRKIKKALEYIEECSFSLEAVAYDPQKLKTVASIAKLGENTLKTALMTHQSVLSLDLENEEDSSLLDTIADPNADPAAGAEQKVFDWLHCGIGLMNLQQKEAYGRKNGPLWSSTLLGILRNNDTVLLEQEDIPFRLRSGAEFSEEEGNEILSRMQNCEALRSLEADNCLWDILILRRYVDFSLCLPHAENTPQELVHAALNRPRDLRCLPGQDKTLAAFLGVSKSAVSQRRETWKRSVAQMLREQEEL
ncbi:MAG: hypothetical protein ACI4JC_04310 [Faecalibacterium sp.]